MLLERINRSYHISLYPIFDLYSTENEIRVPLIETEISFRIIILGYWFGRLWFRKFLYEHLLHIPFNLTSCVYSFVCAKHVCGITLNKKVFKRRHRNVTKKSRGWKSCPEFDRVANFFLFVYNQTFKIFISTFCL